MPEGRSQHRLARQLSGLVGRPVLATSPQGHPAGVLHPLRRPSDRPAATVTRPEFAVVWAALRVRMARAVDDGRTITVDADDRLAVPEAESRRVHKRDRCADCDVPVVTGTVEGSTIYARPRCQRPGRS